MFERDSLGVICEAFLDEAMEYNDLPGLVIGVARGEETFTGARGVRDVMTGDPPQADDIFHCASVSKLFTSSAILKLVDAGVLHLEDRLCDILPEMFPPAAGNEADAARDFAAARDSKAAVGFGSAGDSGAAGDLSSAGVPGAAEDPGAAGGCCFTDPRARGIRIWQMLSHTAGIGDVDDYHWEQALTGETALSDYVHSDEVTGQPLLWAPGTGGFRYSNIAYEILGHIVSRKSGEYVEKISMGSGEGAENTSIVDGLPGSKDKSNLSYEAFVQKFLMQPAGMQDSTMLTFERLDAKGGSTARISDTARSAPTGTAASGSPAQISDLARRSPATAAGACSVAADCAARGGSSVGESPGLITDEIRRRNAAGAPGWHPMALPHEKAPDRHIVPVKYYPYTRSHAPSSTLTSTAADLLKWAQANMQGFADAEAAEYAFEEGLIPAPEAADRPDAFLRFTTYQHIRHEYAEVPNNREKMGLGWFMRRQGGYQLYGHEGTDDGFRASLWICPGLDLAIAVLSNLSGAPVKKLNKKLFDRLVHL